MEEYAALEFSGHLAVFVAIGIGLFWAIALRPKLFWPVLIMASVGTGGILASGYTFIDEYLIAFAILGFLMTRLVRSVSLKGAAETDNLSRFHRWIFFALVVYLVIESVRGIVVLDSIRKIRWVVYHGMLGAISFYLTRKYLYIPENRRIYLLISISGFSYFSYYLVHGVVTEFFLGLGRFDVQRLQWGTAAYSLFPIVIVMPAVIFLLTDKSPKYRKLGFATLVAAILVSFYYDSRAAILAIVFFIAISVRRLGFIKIARYTILFIALFIALYAGFFLTIAADEKDSVLNDFIGLKDTVLNPYKSSKDLDRYIYLKVTFVSISDSFSHFLFGHGYNVHGYAISPYVRDLFSQYLTYRKVLPDDVATEAFTAYIVDTGVIGILFLGLNLFCVYRKVYRSNNPMRIILLGSLCFMFLWSFVINFRDIILCYLMIMPSGLLVQLSRSSEWDEIRGKQ